ncbi:S9 family peptidase [Proteiniphilum sp. X52]|uniref:alpha/beta hydrolase family protein n=1 Tax=Proteiniphilum sp. X52 TaxID=2382159 RepID=UPI000F0A5BB9|nr:S9 family peptidase [Proteiniphilum sp. X52]RNC66799.1 S9 family peptidase [Proteiniphilum sp. X52]
MRDTIIAASLGLFLVIFGVSSQNKWTIDDILRTEQLVFSEISPDGKYVFYQTGTTGGGYPAVPSKFYAVRIDNEHTVELNMPNTVPSVNPKAGIYQWSPDSKQISYLARSEKNNGSIQVWAMMPDGGEPRQLTRHDGDISAYAWSPDASRLLCVTNEPASPEEMAYKKEWGVVLSPEEKIWPQKKVLWMVDLKNSETHKLTDALILSNTPQWSPDGRTIAFLCRKTMEEAPQLCAIDANGNKTLAFLTESEDGVRFFAWAPDGNNIAYVVAGMETPDYVNYHDGASLLPGKIWLHDVAGRASKLLTQDPFPQLGSLKWSRDGKQLVFTAQDPETADFTIYNRYIPLRLHVLSISTGATKVISRDAHLFRGGESITWSADNREVWFTNGEGVGYNLFAADVATGELRHVTRGKKCVSQVTFDKDFKRVAFIWQDINTKPDIYTTDLTLWRPKRVSDLNPWVENYEQEQGEIITYNNEGWEIEALLIKPADFDPNKKYPLLLITHGGPNWHKLNEWLPDWEQYPLKAYSSAGYVMLFPNFRGSANYGTEFIKVTHHDLGRMDFRDAMRGVDYLIDQGFIDEERMGVCGWSYGGFLTPSIITQTTRFKAAQFGAGLPSIEGMYAGLWTVERILHRAFDARPWENGAMHIQYSPLYHAHKVRTPTLIQHGEKDPACPVGGAVLFYKALKSYGIPAVLEIYPGMGHSITDPLLYKRILTKNLEWFNKWLKNDTTTSFEDLYPTGGVADET